jgi:Protein of unknown function (DUF4038)
LGSADISAAAAALVASVWTEISSSPPRNQIRLPLLRKSQGVNAIQTVATGWKRNGTGPRGAFFDGGDVAQPSESFFAGVDEILAYAESQDMLLTVVLLWLANNGGWSGGTAVSPAQFAQYARWLGNRYRRSTYFFASATLSIDSIVQEVSAV